MGMNSASDLWERVVVTGGAGFIGSNLTMEIQRRRPDAHITVVDDFRSGNFSNLRNFRGDVIALDVSDDDADMRTAETTPTIVFHLASITDTTVADQRAMVRDNVEGFRNVLSLCLEGHVPLVYASSAAIYGVNDGRMAESAPAAPANVYAFSKMILDNLARQAVAAAPERHIVGLRYFNVYGPNEAHKGVPASMVYHLYCQMKSGKRPRVFKRGGQKRDFVYVKDAVAATLLAAECSESGIYNIGSGRAMSFNELIAVLNDALGTDYEAEYFDNPYPFYQPFTEADLTEARRVLGYEPRYQLAEGVRDYVEHLERQGAPPGCTEAQTR